MFSKWSTTLLIGIAGFHRMQVSCRFYVLSDMVVPLNRANDCEALNCFRPIDKEIAWFVASYRDTDNQERGDWH